MTDTQTGNNMTPEQVKAMFSSDDLHDEFLKFERITAPRHPRPDVCAMLMLHDLSVPISRGDDDMISAVAHDVIYLNVDFEVFAQAATPEIVIDLLRCGVSYEDDTESLFMFV